ncbi:MAG TPA: peptidylprolyl isomerase [Clostridia bacterium]|nr:peptidylprolyl isomerase [Clostridia bacterium]
MRKSAATALCLLLALLLLSGCSNSNEPALTPIPAATESPSPSPDVSETSNPETPNTTGTPDLGEVVKATIVMKDLGTIELELYPDIAPQSVYNFVSLARQGFYDGLIFHRVIPNFMIQGGDPLGTGMGGPGYFINGEFAANGFTNPISHERGVVSMARRQSPFNSAGSQFFIMHQDYTDLDGLYAAFGRVVSGIEVVDAIAQMETDENDKPLSDVVIESITIDGPELPEPEQLPAE